PDLYGQYADGRGRQRRTAVHQMSPGASARDPGMVSPSANAVVPDVEKHEENKMRFLAALYEIAQKHIKATQDTHDPTMVKEFRTVIAQRAGLMDGEAERIGAELHWQGLAEIRELPVDAEQRPEFYLTQYGLEDVERYPPCLRI